ncbi:type III restriction-modification system [Cutibacterium acnes JCM 18909]|nr:type III restriction-modification system [Cutibacterium acnes JCM 18909]
MRDRLHHMKKLLADDGSIWVHLDYAENHRMRLLLDESSVAQTSLPSSCGRKQTRREVTLNVFRWIKM